MWVRVERKRERERKKEREREREKEREREVRVGNYVSEWFPVNVGFRQEVSV